MRFYIIDDRENDHTYISGAVREAFPDATFALRNGQTFSSWTAVAEFLRNRADEVANNESILLLDMSLGEGDAESQVDEGIRRARSLRVEFPAAIVIACTQYDGILASRVRRGSPFHGVFAKEDWRALESNAERQTYVRTVIEQARPHDRSTVDKMRERATIDDSLGVRSYLAAFGDSALGELIFACADPADNVTVRALTGGLSGAFLFEIKTVGSRGRLSRIVKLARDRELIENEVTGLETYRPALGPLAAALLVLSSGIKRLPCGAYYLEQASVDGEDLLRLMRRDPVAGALQVRSYIALLCACVSDAISAPAEIQCRRLGDSFRFGPLDLERLRVSATFLEEIGPRLIDAGLWPTSMSPAEAAKSLREVASGWRQGQLSFLDVETPVNAQHGDAHLANVIHTGGRQLLIDIARVGVWPTGYDMSRAAIQARLRLLDHTGHADYMPERLPLWFDKNLPATDHGNLVAEQFDSAFDAVAQNSKYCEALRLSYCVGTLWDLLKIASYGDVSPFKRVWAMVTAANLVNQLAA
jgi:hypothetical protein